MKVEFRLGNASAMPFVDESFDFVYCAAAFKNFPEPVKALDEMWRVLRPGGEARIVDLRKDVSLDEINSHVQDSGRNWWDAWLTKMAFKHMLIRRAHPKEDFARMAAQSKFETCEIRTEPMGLEVRCSRPEKTQVASSWPRTPATPDAGGIRSATLPERMKSVVPR